MQDICNFYQCLLDADDELVGGKTYNISDENISIENIAVKIKKYLRINITKRSRLPKLK